MRVASTISGVGEPTLVLLHGLASTRRIFDLVIPHLVQRHKVIAYDQRGHGESEKPSTGYELSDFVADVVEVMHRHGVSRPVLVGHSFGANVALRYAVTERNARGLVLIDGGLVEMHAHLSLAQALEQLAPPADDTAEIERWVREGPELLPNSAAHVEIRRSLFEWAPNGRVQKRLTRERHLASCARAGRTTSTPTSRAYLARRW